MTDDELVSWLQTGRVIITGPMIGPTHLSQLLEERLAEGESAEDAWGALRTAYSPCRAPHWTKCFWCPWESCNWDPDLF
jgi:hypothetical protein